MTFEELAAKVAESIFCDMQEDQFSTFKGMCKCNWWEPKDVQEYICDTIESITEKFWCYDDMSYIANWDDEMPYGKFKRLVMTEIRRLETEVTV